MGQKMGCIGCGNRKTELGFEYRVSIYQAQNCKDCPLRGMCHKAKGNRRIEVNHNGGNAPLNLKPCLGK